ncbi:hypothetical protein A2229_04995 [Candidatus Peregrinibacteria bacterium RIFOXYA2_FULL_33_7]|nr:MAG: hypothetical protein A2229_04995 [Candidatus Peregrinibacteria bacterium RIFOXYA2_FULL_33_7]
MENQKNPEDNEFEIQIPTKTEADSVKIPEKSFYIDALKKADKEIDLRKIPALRDSNLKPTQIIYKGGEGTIFKARDGTLDRDVAIKIIDTQNKTRENTENFLNGARILASLDHQNIPPLHYIITDNGKLILVMKFIEGETLTKHITHCPGNLTRHLNIILEICYGLKYAHSKGIIHRDLKPDNIMIGESNNEVYIVDWGMAKKIAEESLNEKTDIKLPEDETKSDSGIQGTIPYMAPEQLSKNKLDERTDIYQIGCMLFRMLTKEEAFSGNPDDKEKIGKIVENIYNGKFKKPRDINSEIPPEVENIILKCMAKEPENRYQNCEELIKDIQNLLDLEIKKSKADDLIKEGEENFKKYMYLKSEIDKKTKKTQNLENELKTSPPNNEFEAYTRRQEIYINEEFTDRLRQQANNCLTNALGNYHSALTFDPYNQKIKTDIAKLYLEKYWEAEKNKNPQDIEYYETFIKHYDMTIVEEKINKKQKLEIYLDKKTKMEIYRFQENTNTRIRDLIQIADLEENKNFETQLQPGSYLIILENSPSIKYHFVIERNKDLEISLNTEQTNSLPNGYIYIPASKHENNIKNFSIKKYPVTIEEYIEFLNNLAKNNQLEEARKNLPYYTGEEGKKCHYIIEKNKNGKIKFELSETPDKEGTLWNPSWPVLAITKQQAENYCKWMSSKNEKIYRLPSIEEWEKAAGNTDKRTFPWGNNFDPYLCKIANKDTTRPNEPEPVGKRPNDKSPYDVCDMAGNISDWTSTKDPKGRQDLVGVKGGNWINGEKHCPIANTVFANPDQTFTGVGFRPVREEE